ncbi:MAG: GGDEF domain-containing protein [Alphaproteobacteria bacterium]|nr:GGDEF domain-containing protein [Alphaproteobacteria bacterium]
MFGPLRLSWEQVLELTLPAGHAPHVRRHRAELIVSRVQLVCALFAVLTPLWIVVDYAVFPWPLWGILAAMRVGAALSFAALAWPNDAQRSMRLAYLMLALMLAIPPAFYLISRPFLAVEMTGLARLVANAYSLLPYVVVAGLSVFPLTAVEVVICAIPVVAVSMVGALQDSHTTLESAVNTVWLIGLVAGASIFSGMSQLNYMIALINQAAHDRLTGAFTRRSGEETIDLNFRIASRTDTEMTIAFVDVDDFKSINDGFGHDEGDRCLREVAESLRRGLRRSDVLIRWGGEEFVIVLPATGEAGIYAVLARIADLGLGIRPDGRPITASIGISERRADRADDWNRLVDLADHRMYMAKRNGKNCCYGFDDERWAREAAAATLEPECEDMPKT